MPYENALESALARPQQRWRYERRADLSTVAAAYAFGLVKNHPNRDGNTRIGFLALVMFLGINGFEFDAPEPEVVAEILLLADGKQTEDRLANWVRSHIHRSR
jgi:death-on-curing protein